MDGFTINRSLCEVEFVDKDLKGIDVDVMEYVWVKIREYWLSYQKSEYSPPNNYVEIGFSEIKKYIEKHSKNTIIKSVKRLGNLTIVTNQKSFDPSNTYNFTFSILENNKSFKVDFDNDLFKLFDKPKKYCKYDQSDIFQFKEKYTKLLFKFLIGYKKFGVMKKKMFINEDVLMKILNIHSDKPMSKIRSDIFQSSFNKIRENTGLDVDLIKDSSVFKNGSEVIKYIVKFIGYEDGEEHGINQILYNIKKDYKDEVFDNGKIPVFYLRHDEEDDNFYIDDSYNIVGVYSRVHKTKSVSETYKLFNEWYDSKKLGVRIDYLDNFPDFMKKQCLMSKDELKKRTSQNRV